ncbi:MAG TPA: rhomboid family intramembrane serine protease [Allosphingosinicella sp.]|jgi:membrane associated rhomboid family serine protease|nr:rhomboid family intramembrane serine protease [Allosphingosinicella sp.]
MRPPQNWQNARVTLVIAAVTALAWLVVLVTGQEQMAAVMGGFIPGRLHALHGTDLALAVLLTPLTATLIHSGIAHIAFNLIVLLFCGRLVETILGSRAMILLYIVGAYAAAGAHYLAGPHDIVPMVGASGAISAVIGASAMLFGRNRVNVANPVLARWLHALWLAAAWIVLNLLMGYSFELEGITIAVAAHVGGFLAGLALAKPLLLLKWRGA